jgi:hypothetical protein
MVLIGKAVVSPQFTEYQELYLFLLVTEVKGFPDEYSVDSNKHKIVCKNVKRDSTGIQNQFTSACDILLRMTSSLLVKPVLRKSCSPFCIGSSAVNPMVLNLTVSFNVIG